MEVFNNDNCANEQTFKLKRWESEQLCGDLINPNDFNNGVDSDDDINLTYDHDNGRIVTVKQDGILASSSNDKTKTKEITIKARNNYGYEKKVILIV